MSERNLPQAAALLREKKDILIVSHISPDGDTLGSALALALALQSLGKRPQLIVNDSIPDNLFFLPGIAQFKKPSRISRQPDCIVMVDCASLDRSGGDWLAPYLKNVPLLVIDHHKVGDITGTVDVIEPRSAATGELIYLLLQKLGITIEPNIATCLYAALVSDTGGFRFINTTSRTLFIAGALLECGLDLQEININLFERRSKKNAFLYGLALQHLQQSEDLALVWTYLSQEDLNAVGAAGADAANMANAPMLLPGVKVGATFTEENGKVKISFRGRRGYDVAAVAAKIGGGGHASAAGATISGVLTEIMPQVLNLLQNMLKQKEA